MPHEAISIEGPTFVPHMFMPILVAPKECWARKMFSFRLWRQLTKDPMASITTRYAPITR